MGSGGDGVGGPDGLRQAWGVAGGGQSVGVVAISSQAAHDDVFRSFNSEAVTIAPLTESHWPVRHVRVVVFGLVIGYADHPARGGRSSTILAGHNHAKARGRILHQILNWSAVNELN